MYAMFDNAQAFNGDVSNFDTSSVTNMGHMFREATSFNQDTSSWTSKDFELLPFIDKKKYDKSFVLSFPCFSLHLICLAHFSSYC